MKFETNIDDSTQIVEIELKEKAFKVGELEGNYEFTFQNGRYLLRVGTNLYKIDNVQYDGTTIQFSMNGVLYSADVKDEQDLLLDRLGFKTNDAAAEGLLKAPMPGKILDILVNEGDEVEKDQPLAILEAMKMENELKAPISGKIASIFTETGNSLEKNAAILEIETIG